MLLNSYTTKFLRWVLDKSFIFPVELAKWLIYDLLNPPGLELKGIDMFCGLQGSGKTVMMTKALEDIRKKYGDRIKIITNYDYKYQDEPFHEWADFMKVHDKPVVYAIDEIQNYFYARDYAKFPTGLLSAITQTRKMVNHPTDKGIKILCTSQVFANVDKALRDQVFMVWDCGTLFRRFSWANGYTSLAYQEKVSKLNSDMRRRVRFGQLSLLVQSNNFRRLFDTFRLVEDVREKLEKDQYVVRQVMAEQKVVIQPK